MKAYVLTHCSAEENYTPSVFLDKAKAIEVMKANYDENLNNATVVGALYDADFDDDFASITYTDDTYDIYQLFEIEVVEAK